MLILLTTLVLFSTVILLCKYTLKLCAAQYRLPDYVGRMVAWIQFAFPFLLVVLLLRACIAEPFRNTSDLMEPDLLINDYIVINKYQYGLKLPILRRLIFPISTPQRGEIALLDTSSFAIK